MLIHKMIILSTTTTIMTMSTNATSLTIPAHEQVSLSSYYTSLVKRLFIVFGSICLLWFILGLIFASIQTFRHLKKRSYQKSFRYHRSMPAPSASSFAPRGQAIQADNRSLDDDDDDDDDDQSSVFTSVSFLSERLRGRYEHAQFAVPPCERIPEEDFELDLPAHIGMSNMAYSQSTLASTNDGGRGLLYYPACRNFAYSQSTLASSTADLHQHTPTPSVILPVNESSSSTSKLSTSSRLMHLKRHSSQSSTATAFSQITNATYLSSSSTSTSSSAPTAVSVKPVLLPTVMITDCDRLQTDIIELADFEPEKDWRRVRPELRSLLNERMPQAVR